MTTAIATLDTVPTRPITAISTTISTPIGPFTVIARDTGTESPAVLASGWTGDIADLLPVIAASLRPERISSVPAIGDISDAVLRYHEGELDAIDDVAVEQVSGPFLTHAWDVLRLVKPGDPVTYAEFAVLSGRPPAIRAAASACARNAAALFVPCHRVVRTDGSLGGFRWGLPAKQWLLDHERVA
jgi:methylated-DNA-[protein]-cysteine S-methyltransferase